VSEGPKRFDLSPEEFERARDARRRPLTPRDLVRTHVRHPRLIPRTIRTVVAGGADALLNDHSLVWTLHADRIRAAIPGAGTGVDWHSPDEFVRLLLERADAGSRVLDVGCGGGRVARLVAAHVGELVGSDISPVMLEEARESLREQPNASFVETEGATLRPLEDGSFDVVYSYDVFLNFDLNPALALLDEMRRVARPGGVLVLGWDTIDRPEWARDHLRMVRRAARSKRFNASQMRAWTSAQVEHLIETAGFRVVDRRWIGGGGKGPRVPRVFTAEAAERPPED
jgi:ubiquinone/menaquinone biosynthesis C-methylase UbiE